MMVRNGPRGCGRKGKNEMERGIGKDIFML
jgi:hypothetical protein